MGERSSATEPGRREAKPTARTVRAQGDDPLGEATGGAKGCERARRRDPEAKNSKTERLVIRAAQRHLSRDVECAENLTVRYPLGKRISNSN
jgi:hypothetical protein